MRAEKVRHLSVDEVVHIHGRVVELFGGEPGIRDAGLLESALYRPQTGYYSSMSEMAAALLESLLVNHPFIDGNKRVAFFATDVFLRLNGWQLRVESASAHRFMEELLSSGTKYEALVRWIERNIVPLPRG